MPNTQGFELVPELTVDVLRRVMRAAWKSGSDASSEGVIPEHIEIPLPKNLGPYQLQAGTIQIPQEQLGLDMNTAINGVTAKLGTIIHLDIANPPIESARFFDLTADVFLETPIANFGMPPEVGLILENLPAGAVRVVITSPDPIQPLVQNGVEDYVHARFRDGSFPKIVGPFPVNQGPVSMDVRLEMFDDEANPARRITIERPDAAHVKVLIPCYLRFFNIVDTIPVFNMATPMGVNGLIEMLADYQESPGLVRARLSTATVQLTTLTDADDPTERANYNSNETAIAFGGFVLDDMIKAAFATQGTAAVQALGDAVVNVPTLTDIQQAIEQEIRAELNRRKRISIWKPTPPADGSVAIRDVRPRALADALAIGVNARAGANDAALTNFIPAGRDFGIGLSRELVIEKLEAAQAEHFPDGTTRVFEGKNVTLNRLVFSLTDAIRMDGNVSIEDAVLCFDFDADFTANSILEWEETAEGQRLRGRLREDPSISLSAAAWILSIFLGFITFGIVGVIVAVIVMAIATDVANGVGGEVIRNEANEVQAITAWPQTLDKIGNIQSRFENPIGIDPGGVLFSGNLIITSSQALTTTDFARSGGPYLIQPGHLAHFNGGNSLPQTLVGWDFDDGNIANIRKPDHLYGKSGLYIAKLAVQVTESGGVTTRHFAAVRVKNAPPVVTLGPDISVKEGEPFTILGRFTDANWLDKHTATFDFGDNTAPLDAAVMETNNEPQAEGETCATHAYCDDGIYTLTLTIRDDVGGIGRAKMTVRVENVPPLISLPTSINTLVGQPVRLRAEFTDPGWCDTHRGWWDLGDCTKKRYAVIEETHQPPQGEGSAEVVHIYQKCGRFQAIVEILDDDNGRTEAAMIVNAVHLKNASMEAGFRKIPAADRQSGALVIANEWYPFAAESPVFGQSASVAARSFLEFSADEFICRDGQRAQRIGLAGPLQGGIFQKMAANRDWVYEFTACFHLPMKQGGLARIGIDPLGGIDPNSPNIQWMEAGPSLDWENLTVRAMAQNEVITLFLGGIRYEAGQHEVFWDDAALYQIQPFEQPESCVDTCVDFSQFKKGETFDRAFLYRTLEFVSLGQRLLGTVDFGQPVGGIKLNFPDEGLQINFPAMTDNVTLTVQNFGGRLLEIDLLRNGQPLRTEQLIISNETKRVVFEEKNMNGLRIRGGKNEASLVEICLCLPNDEKCDCPKKQKVGGNTFSRDDV